MLVFLCSVLFNILILLFIVVSLGNENKWLGSLVENDDNISDYFVDVEILFFGFMEFDDVCLLDLEEEDVVNKGLIVKLFICFIDVLCRLFFLFVLLLVFIKW